MTTETDSSASVPARSCGNCRTCCIYLGIDELQKPVGTPCKHLRKTGLHRPGCSIYSSRPAACVRYSCAWKMGLFSDDFRPDKSGLLISFYQGEIEGADLTATIVLTDSRKCGDFKSGPLSEAIQALTARHSVLDIRVVNYVTRIVFHFTPDGKIRRGNLLPTESVEELKFATFDPPIGTFRIEIRTGDST